MSFLSGNLTSILLKTKKSSDSLSQQNAKENNSQTAFVIEVCLDIKKIIEKPPAAINLQQTTPVLLHMDKKGVSLDVCLFATIISKLKVVCCFMLFQTMMYLVKNRLHLICGENFNANFDRCVCSEHFVGKR